MFIWMWCTTGWAEVKRRRKVHFPKMSALFSKHWIGKVVAAYTTEFQHFSFLLHYEFFFIWSSFLFYARVKGKGIQWNFKGVATHRNSNLCIPNWIMPSLKRWNCWCKYHGCNYTSSHTLAFDFHSCGVKCDDFLHKTGLQQDFHFIQNRFNGICSSASPLFFYELLCHVIWRQALGLPVYRKFVLFLSDNFFFFSFIWFSMAFAMTTPWLD